MHVEKKKIRELERELKKIQKTLDRLSLTNSDEAIENIINLIEITTKRNEKKKIRDLLIVRAKKDLRIKKILSVEYKLLLIANASKREDNGINKNNDEYKNGGDDKRRSENINNIDIEENVDKKNNISKIREIVSLDDVTLLIKH